MPTSADPKEIAIRIIDVVVTPFVFLGGLILKLARRIGLERMPLSKNILLGIGVFPIRNHYYEPLFDERQLLRPLSEPRKLPGIDWNLEEQLGLLSLFHFQEELLKIPMEKSNDREFYFDNTAFGVGDGEFFYSIIRLKKPRRIIEIGSGFSTLVGIAAIKANREENPAYTCEHICIEPYEMPWLEKTPVQVIRKRVEEVDDTLFSSLKEDDLLFIDSSHMIRPQGDVLVEYLNILPSLNKGVIVHIHDIFTPRDYPAAWVLGEVRFWNEQYLLEAFLTHNRDWKIIGAVNFLHRTYTAHLSAKCPRLTVDRNPGSFYIQKVS